MSQAANFNALRVPPAAPSTQWGRTADSFDALLSNHTGPTAPPYAVEGTIWADTATAGQLIYKVARAAPGNTLNWIVIGVLDIAANAWRSVNRNPIVALASASTVDLGAQPSETIRITGTNGVSGFGVAQAGTFRRVIFDDALVLTNSAALILPGGANVTTAAGDSLEAVSLGSGNWQVIGYAPATIRLSLAAVRDVTSATGAADRALKASDFGRLITLGGSADFTLGSAAMSALGNGWWCDVRVTAANLVTIDPDGAATIDGLATLVLAIGQTCRIWCDGTQLRSIGLERTVTLEARALAASAASVALALPKGYGVFKLSSYVRLAGSAATFLTGQLSTNGGSSWITSGYSGHAVFGQAGAAGAVAATTSGLQIVYNNDGGFSIADSTLGLSGAAGLANCMVTSGGYINSGNRAVMTSYAALDAATAGVNAIRLISASGAQILAGSTFILKGQRDA